MNGQVTVFNNMFAYSVCLEKMANNVSYSAHQHPSAWEKYSLVPSSLFGFPTREVGRKKSLVHTDCTCAGFTYNEQLINVAVKLERTLQSTPHL